MISRTISPKRTTWTLALSLAVTALAGAASLHCSSGSKVVGPDEDNPSRIRVEISPSSVPADGTTADVTVIALATGAKPGEGSVSLRASAGSLGGSGISTTVNLSNGRATLAYACNAALVPTCVGVQTVTATWETTGKEATGQVQFTAVAQPSDGGTDSGRADGGGTADAGGTPDSGGGTPEGGTGGNDASTGTPDAGSDAASGATETLQLSTSKVKIFAGIGDFAEVTAVVKQKVGGALVPNADVTFFATNGRIGALDGGTLGPSLIGHSDVNGVAKARFTDDPQSVAGIGTISAQSGGGGSQAVSVEISRVQQIIHNATTCGGQGCAIMGYKGTGFNEQAQVSFKVTDASGAVVPGAAVDFAIVNGPAGTTCNPTGVTNASGITTTNVAAGAVPGTFTVRATVSGTVLSVESATIGIRGAKAANKDFVVQCDKRNIPAYTNYPLAPDLQVNCQVKLVDRFNTAVGTGQAVNIRVETGTAPSTVQTQAFVAGGNNTSEGRGSFTFNTLVADWAPVDVAPFDEDPNQLPLPRAKEPRHQVSSALTRNPRDGLVTILAYVRGEEYFQDTNNNGQYDLGEKFYDSGEPLVDSNDNGVWDPGELFIDANQDNVWNGPNGVWDEVTTIWTEARILYTDYPTYLADPSPPVGSYWEEPQAFSRLSTYAFGSLPKGGSAVVSVFFRDKNFNLPAPELGLGINPGPSIGSASSSMVNPDRFGMDFQRKPLDTTSNQDCSPASVICQFRYVFVTWGTGNVNFVTVRSEGVQGTSPPTSVNVGVTGSLGIQILTLTTSGVLNAP